MSINKPTKKEEVVESVCDQIKRIMNVGPIRKAEFYIIIDWEGLPIVDSLIETFAPVQEKQEESIC